MDIYADFQYRIKELIEKEDAEKQAALRKEIIRECEVSRKALWEWSKRPINAPTQLKYNHVLKISKILGVEPDQLLTKNKAAVEVAA